MVAYEVEIYTGTKPDAETESKISINLVDTKGDSEKKEGFINLGAAKPGSGMHR